MPLFEQKTTIGSIRIDSPREILANKLGANQAGVWRISLAPGTAPGTMIPFQLTLTCGGTTWQDWFSLTTY